MDKLNLHDIYINHNSFFRMWCDDYDSMIETMVNNRNADINAGYNPLGDCIKRQNAEIEEYKEKYYQKLFDFVFFKNAEQVNNWCFIDMLKRGVIEA